MEVQRRVRVQREEVRRGLTAVLGAIFPLAGEGVGVRGVVAEGDGADRHRVKEGVGEGISW